MSTNAFYAAEIIFADARTTEQTAVIETALERELELEGAAPSFNARGRTDEWDIRVVVDCKANLEADDEADAIAGELARLLERVTDQQATVSVALSDNSCFCTWGGDAVANPNESKCVLDEKENASRSAAKTTLPQGERVDDYLLDDRLRPQSLE
jgi:hypothetical protein